MEYIVLRLITASLVAVTLLVGTGCGKAESPKPAANNTTPPVARTEVAPEAVSTEAPVLGKAPLFTLKGLDGKDINLADYNGKVVLLNFWATWCPPCKMEIPHFNELVQQYGPKGFVVLGVSVDKGGVAIVQKFKAGSPVNYQVVMDNGQVANKYQTLLPEEDRGGIPNTFLIDRTGTIRKTFVGYRDKATWEAEIKAIL
jgi:peroxiredoxin